MYGLIAAALPLLVKLMATDIEVRRDDPASIRSFIDDYAEARAKAILRMQELDWPLGETREVVVGREWKQMKWWQPPREVVVTRKMFVILMGAGMLFRRDGDVLIPVWRGSESGQTSVSYMTVFDVTAPKRTFFDQYMLMESLRYIANYET